MRFRVRPGWFTGARARADRHDDRRDPTPAERYVPAAFVEPSVRRLVADRLGVIESDLALGVSLRDDLAADSLDLVDLTLALEAAFAIVIPVRLASRVRTYDQLVTMTAHLVRARHAQETSAETATGAFGFATALLPGRA